MENTQYENTISNIFHGYFWSLPASLSLVQSSMKRFHEQPLFARCLARNKDVFYAGMLLSAGHISHSAAFQPPEGVTWSGGHVIYVD